MKTVTKIFLAPRRRGHPGSLGNRRLCIGGVRRPCCWHTATVYEYPPEAGVVVHPDDWRWGSTEKYSWREHEGGGDWRGDRWMEW